MTRQRRSFTAEFKLEAASLVLDQGCPRGKPLTCRRSICTAPLGSSAPGGAWRLHSQQEGPDARAAKNPGAGGPN